MLFIIYNNKSRLWSINLISHIRQQIFWITLQRKRWSNDLIEFHLLDYRNNRRRYEYRQWWCRSHLEGKFYNNILFIYWLPAGSHILELPTAKTEKKKWVIWNEKSLLTHTPTDQHTTEKHSFFFSIIWNCIFIWITSISWEINSSSINTS